MKKRTLNEYRQTKEYQGSEEGKKYLDDLETPSQSFVEDQEAAKQMAEITLNEQMQEIAEIVAPTINDVIFNEIIEVMSNYDELNWGWFVQDDAPTALLDACFDHKTEIHYEIFQLVLQKLNHNSKNKQG